jgi:LmbE family N-acetylglucosaminyl deacetylase
LARKIPESTYAVLKTSKLKPASFMKKIFLLSFLLSAVTIFAQQQKTLVAVFPHPDDETAIAEILVKYKAMGYKVQLIIATNGKDGTRVTKIPAGDSLGNLRKEESRCACKMMEIEEPIFLGIERLDTKIGVGNYFREHRQFLNLLKAKIDSINPSFIITFGPDGDTHHSEHIVTGAAVTELLLREGWVDRFPLYYVAWTKKQSENFMDELGYVDEQYFNVKQTYSQQEENKALEIMPCYSTQFTEEEIADDKKKKIKDKTNTIHFRKFVVKKGMQEGFE